VLVVLVVEPNGNGISEDDDEEEDEYEPRLADVVRGRSGWERAWPGYGRVCWR